MIDESIKQKELCRLPSLPSATTTFAYT